MRYREGLDMFMFSYVCLDLRGMALSTNNLSRWTQWVVILKLSNQLIVACVVGWTLSFEIYLQIVWRFLLGHGSTQTFTLPICAPILLKVFLHFIYPVGSLIRWHVFPRVNCLCYKLLNDKVGPSHGMSWEIRAVLRVADGCAGRCRVRTGEHQVGHLQSSVGAHWCTTVGHDGSDRFINTTEFMI
jgi:hypothetical protein